MQLFLAVVMMEAYVLTQVMVRVLTALSVQVRHALLLIFPISISIGPTPELPLHTSG
jgi:hypothetical protein